MLMKLALHWKILIGMALGVLAGLILLAWIRWPAEPTMVKNLRALGYGDLGEKIQQWCDHVPNTPSDPAYDYLSIRT